MFHTPPLPVRALAIAAVLAVSATPRSVAAQGAENAYAEGLADSAPLLIPLLLAPSSVGPEFAFPKDEAYDFRFILGWPFQIPLPFGKNPTYAHRVALAPEVALGARNKAGFRGRLGYRFGHRWFFFGAGVLADRSTVFVSPEVGLRYPPAENDFAFGGALFLRSDVDPQDGVVRLSAQIGWVML